VRRSDVDVDPIVQFIFLESGFVRPSSVSGKPSTMLPVVVCVACAVVLAGAFTYFGIGWIVSMRHTNWLQSLPLASLVAIRDEQERKKKAAIEAMTESMFQSAFVPWLIRWLVPLTLLGSSCLFLIGVFIYSSHAFIYLRLIRKDLLVRDFKFSIVHLAKGMWEGGGRVLAVSLRYFVQSASILSFRGI
jgi:hypothetical protein